jgi:3-deoxy-D-manno-octulosonic-acid transferase
VRRALDRIRPSLVVLAELELWPNFIGLARRLGCAIAVINGRMSPRSLRGYRRIRPFMAWLLKKIDLLAVQNQDYAKRLLTLGAAAGRLHVTGSVKFDGVTTRRDNQKTKELGRLLGISRSRATAHGPRPSVPLVWVAGSTQEPEEEIVLGIYGRARQRFPGLRLILVPRHKERFDAVARLLERSGFPFVRRSRLIEPLANPDAIILLDTLGELSALWGLADLAFVGGSLTRRGGQNMIEPSGYGAAVTFGPHVWNFQDTADRLLECGGAIQAADAAELERETHRLLADAAARQHLGWAAQEFVQSQQGATDRTLALLDDLIRQRDPAVSAA